MKKLLSVILFMFLVSQASFASNDQKVATQSLAQKVVVEETDKCAKNNESNAETELLARCEITYKGFHGKGNCDKVLAALQRYKEITKE